MALSKASQCLRERTPEVMPFLAKLEEQVDLHRRLIEQDMIINASVSDLITPVARLENNNNDIWFDWLAKSTDLTLSLLEAQRRAVSAAHEALGVHNRQL